MVVQLLLWLIAGFLALVTLFMILPVRVAMSLQNDPANRATVLVRPFGGISPQIEVYDSSRKSKSKSKSKATDARKSAQREKSAGKMRARDNFVTEVVVLVRRVLCAIHIEVLRVDADFGLGDPADTGQLFGHFCPLIYTSGGHVNLRPDFGEACLRGNIIAQFRVIPVALIWPFVGFGWRVFGPFR
ncbi:DUF2953 domain-containing protein [Yoonia sp.]|uniref:DUF2953 domain-containing protein n=1 Tax=Yoonia sp. TaxID=2212373 RepID=UPI0025FEF209|nr:DUF2953 domain-containing protein [Yoonia sp.]